MITKCHMQQSLKQCDDHTHVHSPVASQSSAVVLDQQGSTRGLQTGMGLHSSLALHCSGCPDSGQQVSSSAQPLSMQLQGQYQKGSAWVSLEPR